VGGKATNAGVGQVSSQEVNQPLVPVQGPAPETHLFGDWDGFRTRLDNLGIHLSMDYITESAGVVAGGIRHGVDYAHQIGIEADIDWERLAGIAGLTTHTVIVNRAGRNASADYVGDTVIQAQEIFGAGFDQAVNLVEFYAEESLQHDRINLAAGRFFQGADFAASPLYCNFMTLTICGHPRALTAEQDFVDWPRSVWGARARFRPTTDTYVMAGVYQSQPFPTSTENYTQGGYSGFNWTFRGTTGVSVPVELAYEPVIGRDQLPGHYKVGMTWDTSSFPDNYADAAGGSFVLSGLPPRSDKGRAQIWVTFDQMVVRTGRYQNDGLILLAAYAHDDPQTSLFRNFVWLGMLYSGFWPSRHSDQIGFAYTYYDVSDQLTATEELQASLGDPLEGGARGVQSHASVFELNYNLPLYRGVQVQPELEYFIRPGGTHAVPNAFLLGLKTHVSF
jgi:porin